MASSGSTATPFGFVGGQGYHGDSDSGLMLVGARYYDRCTGHFISRDPSGFNGADVNLYRYCGNDPTNQTDPTGLITGEAALGAALAVGAVALGVAVIGAPTTIPLIIGGAFIGGTLGAMAGDADVENALGQGAEAGLIAEVGAVGVFVGGAFIANRRGGEPAQVTNRLVGEKEKNTIEEAGQIAATDKGFGKGTLTRGFPTSEMAFILDYASQPRTK